MSSEDITEGTSFPRRLLRPRRTSLGVDIHVEAAVVATVPGGRGPAHRHRAPRTTNRMQRSPPLGMRRYHGLSILGSGWVSRD